VAASRTALFALLILVVFIVADWLFQSANDQASRDVDLVYCLAPAHQGGLVNSAASLGLIDPGSTPSAIRVSGSVLPLTAWRSRDGGDFQRACDAYAAPAARSGDSSGQGGGVGGVLGILLPVAAGALLTLAADEFKQGSNRRWAQADALRDSWSAFRGIMDAYLRERRKAESGELPSERDIDDLRRDLVTRLRVIKSQHRRSPTVGRLKRQLTIELGGPGVAARWTEGADPVAFGKRKERAAEIAGHLDEFESSLEEVAGKLERRIWLSWRL
jgi:hypothetical protein